jgi:hypothetical protein
MRFSAIAKALQAILERHMGFCEGAYSRIWPQRKVVNSQCINLFLYTNTPLMGAGL